MNKLPMRRAFCAWLLFLLGACAESKVNAATEVVVVVYSDLTLASVEAEILDEVGSHSAAKHTFSLDAKTSLPLSFSVYQPAGGADWFRLVARGFDERGKKLVEHTVIARFDHQRSTLLQVSLRKACAGTFCNDDPNQTCYGESRADDEINAGECQPVERVVPKIAPKDAGPDAEPAADAAGPTKDAGPTDAGTEPDVVAPGPDTGPAGPSDGSADAAALEPCVVGKSILGGCLLQ